MNIPWKEVFIRVILTALAFTVIRHAHWWGGLEAVLAFTLVTIGFKLSPNV